MLTKKKLLVCVLAVMVAVCLGGAALAEDLAGGWYFVEDIPTCELPENLAELFDNNLGLLGATFQPITYLATQVVAGTNHLVLCLTSPVVPDAQPHLSAVTIYENLNGELEVLAIVDINLHVFLEPVANG